MGIYETKLQLFQLPSEPAPPESSVRLATRQLRAPSQPPQPISILLVDDDALCRRAVAHMLGGSGHHVAQAGSGQEALDELSQRAFDVVVSDFSMPGMDGFELLRRVRERNQHLSFVLFSGDTSLEVATKAMDLGATRYLLKPLNVAQLLAAIEQSAELTRERDRGLRAKRLIRPTPADWECTGPDSLKTLTQAMRSLWIAHQPVVHAGDHQLSGYELLMRFDSPGTLGPLELLELARRCGRLPMLGRHIRQRAAVAAGALTDGELVFVNLHPSELTDSALLDPHSPLAQIADRIVFELKNRESLDEIPDLVSRVHQLRALGFRLAIDEVGVGYSGLNTIVLLEPEFVKIDRSLVCHIDCTPIHRRIVASMIQLARDLGMTVISEGVETEAERDALVELGVDLLQGYLIAKPEREPSVPPLRAPLD